MDWIKRWGPAIIFMVAIFIFSSVPGNEMPDFGIWDYFTKKGGHMLGYALLASAYYFAINKGKIQTSLHFILAICLAAIYASSDEWHQSFVPGRHCSLVDVGIDTLGGSIGVTVFCLVRKMLSMRRAAANASTD